MPRKPAEKKVPAPKQRKHPSYEEMIYKAIAHKHSVKGSSIAAIHQFILNTYDDLPSNDAVKIQVRLSLKRLIARGSIEKVKASYKLADSTKEKLKKEKKTTKSPAPKKTTTEKKEPTEKKKPKPSPKKSTPTKVKSSPKKGEKLVKKKPTSLRSKIAKSKKPVKATPPKVSSPKKTKESPKKKSVPSPTKAKTTKTGRTSTRTRK